MGSKLCTDRTRIALAIASACLALLWPGSLGQIAAIAATACFGLWRLKPLTAQGQEHSHLHIPVGRPAGVVWLLAFTALLLALPVAAQAWGDNLLSMFDAFLRAGSLDRKGTRLDSSPSCA